MPRKARTQPKRMAHPLEIKPQNDAHQVRNAMAVGVVDTDESNPLGGATSEEIAQVAADEFGRDPELDASESMIAMEGLARIVVARMEHSDWPNDPKSLAIFIVTDRPRDLAETLNAVHVPILDNGSAILTGKLWIVSPSMVSGYYVDFSDNNPGQAFAEVRAKGLDKLRAVIFDPEGVQPELRHYPQGLEEDERVQKTLIAGKTFTTEALIKALALFHESSIITPDAAGRPMSPWRDGLKYVPRPSAEAFLQGWLKSQLWMAFQGGCVIKSEMPGTEGRCDLLVLSKHPTTANTWICHAALELKVLRSLTSGAKAVSKTTLEAAIEKGLGQVTAYMSEQLAAHGFLCCYDMRTPKHCDGDSLFKPIQRRANQRGIVLRRYRLYGTSEDLRSDKYRSMS
jgi:hypothetical protein